MKDLLAAYTDGGSDYLVRRRQPMRSRRVESGSFADVARMHQFRIAKDTLKMSDAVARIMGGMTKDEAVLFLINEMGWSPTKLATYLKSLDYTDEEINTLIGQKRPNGENPVPEQITILKDLVTRLADTARASKPSIVAENIIQQQNDMVVNVYFNLDLDEKTIPDGIQTNSNWDGGIAARDKAIAELEQMFKPYIATGGMTKWAYLGDVSFAVKLGNIPAVAALIAKQDTSANEGVLRLDVKDPRTGAVLTFVATDWSCLADNISGKTDEYRYAQPGDWDNLILWARSTPKA